MKDLQLAEQRATTFLSDTVGLYFKLNVEEFNFDKMVDRAV